MLVRLHTRVDSLTPIEGGKSAPQEIVTDLQEFTTAVRAIYSHARDLGWIVPFLAWDPYGGSYKELQLPPDITAETVKVEVIRLTPIYQDIRLYATNVLNMTSIIWGAIANCILPVLYALLGSYAYLLQVFSDKLQSRTFLPSDSTTARFIIAAIGGAIVGLFNNFTFGQGASVSPLAIAFLVGYAADVFFSFLAHNLPKPKSD